MCTHILTYSSSKFIRNDFYDFFFFFIIVIKENKIRKLILHFTGININNYNPN